MDRLFRGSGLYRDKWDSPRSGSTYGNNVIEEAVKHCIEVYCPDNLARFAPNLKPDDYTDMGQSRVLSREYGNRLRYSRATKWICYNGQVWQETEIKADGLAQALTERQLEDAITQIHQAKDDLDSAEKDGDKQRIALAKVILRKAEDYYDYVLTRRNRGKLSAALNVSQPMLEIDVALLDADTFKLNTTDGTVDLRTGQLLPHDPTDYCTKITAVSPSDEGAEIFSEFLKIITCGDKDLEDYLQMASGMEIIGKVFCENLEIVHGGGRNGKSTYYNTKAWVLGDYSGSLSAETLTVNCRKNKSPEYAELRGKRLVIAAELEEGMRLDTAIVKKLCSTDPIYAEKKYKDPFSFIPSHTVVLYTNHLPKVGTSDSGTWRRLIVIPFNAVIEGNADIKNYSDYLFQNAGGAVLKWMIDGAVKFIAAGYKIEPPEVVRKAIEDYRNASDWITNYIFERCETDKSYIQKSGEIYSDYRDYCKQTGDYARSAADFKMALEAAGYEWRRPSTGAVFYGLRLRQDDLKVAPIPYVNLSRSRIPAPIPAKVTEDYGDIQNFLELKKVDF